MKKTITMVMIVASLFLIGCSTHVHTVGTGPQTGQVESARQWYILFGAIPLNSVDTGAMAGGASNYEIKTVTGPVDILIGIPASYITVSSRTVTVTK
jgi:hypothetical protein